MTITTPETEQKQCDKEAEYMIVYEGLLAMERELETEPALAEFSDAIYRDLEEFRENYPEIIAEYHSTKTKGESNV